MSKTLKFIYNYTDFMYLFLITNFIVSVVVSPFLWLYRDIFQASMNPMVAIMLIVFYLMVFWLVFINNKFFYFSFNFLISEKLKNFFLKLACYVPFTNYIFLMILGFSSFLCFLFYNKNDKHLYLFYYNILLDSIRLLIAPGLIYFAFLRFFSTNNIVSLLLKKNYFEFSKTSITEVRMLLEAFNIGAKQFMEMPINEKIALIGALSGPGLLTLHKGAKSKEEALNQLDNTIRDLGESEQTFLKTHGHLLTPEQYQIAVDHFAKIKNELSDVRRHVNDYNDAQFGYGWLNSLIGRQTKTMEDVATTSDFIQKKANNALSTGMRVIYPEGSLGHIKNMAGLNETLTSPKIFEKIPSILESSCSFCKKFIYFFGC